MSFDDVLAVLLGWVGEQISVGITSADGPSAMVANLAGRLRSGSELSPDAAEGPVYFHLDDGGTGFMLARDSFVRAELHADGSLLVVQTGTVELWIEHDEPRGPG